MVVSQTKIQTPDTKNFDVVNAMVLLAASRLRVRHQKCAAFSSAPQNAK